MCSSEGRLSNLSKIMIFSSFDVARQHTEPRDDIFLYLSPLFTRDKLY